MSLPLDNFRTADLIPNKLWKVGFILNITGKNESLPRIVKNMVFLWKNFGILVEYRFSKESITLQRISDIWNNSNFGKLQEFCWSLTLKYLWNFCGNI